LLAVFAAVSLFTGLWAVIDPAGWFRSYPGFGHHWVSVQGGFDRHLATDAGAGFVAVGVVLLVAFVWPRRPSVVAAGTALVAHSIPHFVFHLTHPVAGFPALDTLFAVWGILAEVVAGLALLIMAPTLP